MSRGRQAAGLLGALSILLTTCRGPVSDRPRVFPASGELFVDGKPAVKAHVQLQAPADPALDQLRPHAVVGIDGTFRLTTFTSADGAPAGDYVLTVTWSDLPRLGHDQEGPDRFLGRYADPSRPVRAVRIQPGDNQLGRIDLP
jgi:hypothetical protein